MVVFPWWLYMVAGVDPTGPMDETSQQETTNCKAVTLHRRVLIVLIVLVVSMIKGVPVNVDALERLMLY